MRGSQVKIQTSKYGLQSGFQIQKYGTHILLYKCCKDLLSMQRKVNAGGFGKASTMTYRDTKTDCQHFKMNPSSRILDTRTRT